MMILDFIRVSKFEMKDILDGPCDMMLQVCERLTLLSIYVVALWITFLGWICMHASKHVLQAFKRLTFLVCIL